MFYSRSINNKKQKPFHCKFAICFGILSFAVFPFLAVAHSLHFSPWFLLEMTVFEFWMLRTFNLKTLISSSEHSIIYTTLSEWPLIRLWYNQKPINWSVSDIGITYNKFSITKVIELKGYFKIKGKLNLFPKV